MLPAGHVHFPSFRATSHRDLQIERDWRNPTDADDHPVPSLLEMGNLINTFAQIAERRHGLLSVL